MGGKRKGTPLTKCYQAEDTGNPVRWCARCQKWIHEGCCGNPVKEPLEKAEDFDQGYLDIQASDIREANPQFDFLRLVTTPIQRIPGRHQAPFSLEKLQVQCRVHYEERRIPSCLTLTELVQEVQFFRSWDEADAESTEAMVTKALDYLKGRSWFVCPACQSQYI
jgi:hypothetical protein